MKIFGLACSRRVSYATCHTGQIARNKLAYEPTQQTISAFFEE